MPCIRVVQTLMSFSVTGSARNRRGEACSCTPCSCTRPVRRKTTFKKIAASRRKQPPNQWFYIVYFTVRRPFVFCNLGVSSCTPEDQRTSCAPDDQKSSWTPGEFLYPGRRASSCTRDDQRSSCTPDRVSSCTRDDQKSSCTPGGGEFLYPR